MRWVLLVLVTIGVTVPLDLLGVPSAALFAALLVGVVLAIARLAPARVPRIAGLAAQGALGVYIGTMVHSDSLSALGPHWPVVIGVGVVTLVLSIGAGALLGLHRDISPLTGALALVAGGASGLVAIARELGGDDRIVAVVQYLRVAVITAAMPVVVTLVYHADRSARLAAGPQSHSAPWYLSLMMIIVLVVAGAAVGRLARLPGSGLLGPMALTIMAELAGLSFGLTVPALLVSAAYMVIGWQAGVAFTRESLRAIERLLPAALGLIVLLNVATAGLGVALAKITGVSMLDGYLATSPGGIYAVLATAVETGSNVTFIIATQVLRVLLMLFAAPLLARAFVRLTYRRASTEANSDPIAVAEARPAAKTSS
ncbi:AbrB family transcriptional regulator [Mycobacterium sp. shizuoka-1]|uniref:AbrB family transcriptional regulator n=1 Tax=Mycobacterium sp. shizuoka-1 TaxID=2039281 RepID=UPI000C061198|nr:AbrB family transcriptional regulator [Mycobacterium sp. shizuoka-1]GAY18927.1 membrane protein [Mycobacterium sp. shizuoka-1]